MGFFEYLRQIQAPKPTGILQIGANTGQEISIFHENAVDLAILVEPQREQYEKLARKADGYNMYVPINALCAETSGEEYSLHVASNDGASSSLLEPTGHLTAFPSVKFSGTMTVNSHTVDDLMVMLGQTALSTHLGRIDTLYMDTQGSEYNILLGAMKTLKQIKYIYMEYMRPGFYRNAKPLESYLNLLENLGFTLNNINFNLAHHSDALFVKKSLLGLQD